MTTLPRFLIVIKLFHEFCAFFMMQLDTFDRQEDRPYALK